MPINPGGAPSGRGFGNTKSKERGTIVSKVIAWIKDPNAIKDTRNNIGNLARSTGFHIDAQELLDGEHQGYFKVDIQRATATKDTVAQVIVASDVTDAAEIRAGLEASLEDGQKYIVTR